MDVSTVNQPAVRTVEIAPPSARAETLNVLRAAALIVLATWIYIADTAAPAGSGAGASSRTREAGAPEARELMPYQRLFRSLGGDDQRLFRELQEGLLEAENARSTTRRWPAPAALAAQGIPPFADAAGRGGRRLYRWQLRQEGPIVNYLGMPADRRDPELLLLVQEPDSPAPAAQATDEVHHRLADGTLLHVSTWLRETPAGGGAGAAGPSGVADDRGREPGVIAMPYARGWIQVLVGATPQ
jgi:hypothetical protein